MITGLLQAWQMMRDQATLMSVFAYVGRLPHRRVE